MCPPAIQAARLSSQPNIALTRRSFLFFGDRLHNREIAGRTPLLTSFTSSFGFGTVGVLGVIRRLDDSAVCYDFETVNTGGPGASIQELKQILRRGGLAPNGF